MKTWHSCLATALLFSTILSQEFNPFSLIHEVLMITMLVFLPLKVVVKPVASLDTPLSCLYVCMFTYLKRYLYKHCLSFKVHSNTFFALIWNECSYVLMRHIERSIFCFLGSAIPLWSLMYDQNIATRWDHGTLTLLNVQIVTLLLLIFIKKIITRNPLSLEARNMS